MRWPNGTHEPNIGGVSAMLRWSNAERLDVHLAYAEFAVNSVVNSGTKLAPFEADLGYIPRNPLQLAADQLSKVRHAVEFHERQATILLRCREALAQAQERMKDVYDRNRAEKIF
ncbi:hypothetical protein PC128_g17973 [Phytophthora cactorum]|nr:hypothetical protein PC120_g19255 [Phytophthora cactorum]KAG3174669.1 hypothetical protein PC128_g17973 [Phytophthora cactorum]